MPICRWRWAVGHWANLDEFLSQLNTCSGCEQGRQGLFCSCNMYSQF